MGREDATPHGGDGVEYGRSGLSLPATPSELLVGTVRRLGGRLERPDLAERRD